MRNLVTLNEDEKIIQENLANDIVKGKCDIKTWQERWGSINWRLYVTIPIETWWKKFLK